MKTFPLPGSRFTMATTILALSTFARAATPDDVVATSVSSTSSSTFVSGGIAECEFDLLVADAATFEALSLEVDGPLSNTRCELGTIPQLEGAELEEVAFHRWELAQASPPIPAGAVLLHCDSDTFIGFGESITVDFLDIEAPVLSATGVGGEAVALPRLCATGISCSYFGGGDFDWNGDPRCGDANYNYRITAIDALGALRTSIGQPSCVPVESVCDANGDLEVSASDALLILRASVLDEVALECPLPCPPGTGAF